MAERNFERKGFVVESWGEKGGRWETPLHKNWTEKEAREYAEHQSRLPEVSVARVVRVLYEDLDLVFQHGERVKV